MDAIFWIFSFSLLQWNSHAITTFLFGYLSKFRQIYQIVEKTNSWKNCFFDSQWQILINLSTSCRSFLIESKYRDYMAIIIIICHGYALFRKIDCQRIQRIRWKLVSSSTHKFLCRVIMQLLAAYLYLLKLRCYIFPYTFYGWTFGRHCKHFGRENKSESDEIKNSVYSLIFM